MAHSATWTGCIGFGRVEIPVKLESAKEEKSLHFNMLDSADFSPIKMKRVNAKSGREVPYGRIVKAYEHKKDQFVVLNKQDFVAANPKATRSFEIEDFVPADAVDPMLFDRPYYIVPREKGEKAYLLLRDALVKTEKVGVGRLVFHNKQHLALVVPRGSHLVLQTLHFPHEVIEASEAGFVEDHGRKKKYTASELKAAEALIEEFSGDWDPGRYEDTYYDDLMGVIRQKVREGRIHEIEEPGTEKKTEREIKGTGDKDLLAALRRSLMIPHQRATPARPNEKTPQRLRLRHASSH